MIQLFEAFEEKDSRDSGILILIFLFTLQTTFHFQEFTYDPI